MLDPVRIEELGAEHVVRHFEKRGYTLTPREPEKSGITYVEAAKLSAKYLVQVQTSAYTQDTPPEAKPANLLYEEKRNLMARASEIGAIAMLAKVKIGADPGNEGNLLDVPGFKRI